MRILIADDHLVIRNGLKFLISSAFPGIEFGETGNGVEAIRLLQESEWTMLLLDIDMPGISGFDVLKYLQSEGVGVPVLVFSFHREEQIILRAFEMGASAYVTKDAGADLITAIRRILIGKRNTIFREGQQ